jgi:hypothetical protein
MIIATAMRPPPRAPAAARASPGAAAVAPVARSPSAAEPLATASAGAAKPTAAIAPVPTPAPEHPLLSMAGLPQVSADERAALRADLSSHADPEAELARVLDYLAFDAAFRHWREASSGPPSTADERARQAALARALAAELDTRLARRELTAAEAAAARRMLQDGPLR